MIKIYTTKPWYIHRDRSVYVYDNGPRNSVDLPNNEKVVLTIETTDGEIYHKTFEVGREVANW